MLKLDHVVFPVREAARTLAFYRGTLGLPLVQAIEGDDWGGFPWLMMIFGLGEGADHLVCVALGGAPAPDYAGLPNDVRHYALLAEGPAGLDRWEARLTAAGVAYWVESHGERRSLYFEDPDGVVLEITWPAEPPGTREDRDAVAAAEAWAAAHP